MLQSVRVASARFVLTNVAPLRLAPLRSALVRLAPLRLAPLRLAPLRSAPLRFALLRSAPPRLAFPRLAPLRIASHYSRTSSSQLCKVNGSTCLHLASSTCRDVTPLDRQRLHGSQPPVPHGVSKSGVVW